ncbi:hypothetical protein [Halomicrobium salinisoli]|uniref:hypothetical protein n=1 Tax=Halomicrobium salinisoli TaxID=2878391 RepID=UPI001CF02C62|nr:hypothetical protein [Halomicrobium salinisoli]
MNRDDERAPSRRDVLRAAGGTVGLAGLATGSAAADEDHTPTPHGDCPDGTVGPSMVHYDDSIETVCSDDHPETQELHESVAAALDEQYPTVGSLIDDGFVPYFDFLTTDQATGWSHWLSPEYVGDDTIVDSERPASVLLDHQSWRPIGMMFVATRDGEPVDPPPTVYEDDDGACAPWHAHVGFPGRLSWWKFRVFAAEQTGAGIVPEFPCKTPWMMHVWAHPHPESRYAHDAPPPENRDVEPADPGFETEADPDEDQFGPELLPGGFTAGFDHLP